MPRKIFVTTALPYANAPAHLGHLLGYVQADIWVRAQRMAGNEVHFVCADDAHGTPIMLAAEKQGITPEAFIGPIQASHEADFRDIGIAYDAYHTTHSPENRELAELFYTRLKSAGVIASRAISQLYDPVKSMFLPDRYIKGECPNCGSADQYGDNCEVCGKAYAPTDLKNPKSVVSGATPELRDSEHFFFELPKFEAFLRDWLAGDVAQPSVKAKLSEWVEGGLRDWDISRDAPYFGFPIPGASGKYFYVWLDAPIGYLAALKVHCAGKGAPLAFDDVLAPDSGYEMHHFIGKDIINFHGLFWPAMLHGAGFRTPTRLHVNGYLMVNGAKMSKSRGTFIQARTYLDHLNPDYLRYYFATMSSGTVDDVDLDLKTFEERVNSHLVGKFVNIASRAAGFVSQHFGGALRAPVTPADRACTDVALTQTTGCTELYDRNDFAAVVREVMGAADVINRRWDEAKPWQLAKDPDKREELHAVCSDVLTAFYVLNARLAPIVPKLAAAAHALFLDAPPLPSSWRQLDRLPTQVGKFEHLITRVDPKAVAAMVEASKEDLAAIAGAAAAASAAPAPPKAKTKSEAPASAAVGAREARASAAPAATAAAAPAAPTHIGIDDFTKVDLRIARIAAAEAVPEADKLLRLTLDLGTEQRQVFAGIKSAYDPATLVGRLTVMVANLAPRKMRFGLSEGMVLAASDERGGPFLLAPDSGAQPGMRVK